MMLGGQSGSRLSGMGSSGLSCSFSLVTTININSGPNTFFIFLIHTDMTAVMVQSNMVVSNDIKDD